MRLLPIALVAASLIAGSAAAQTLDRIRDTNKITLGYRTDAAPLSFTGADGNPAGYSPIICDQIARSIAKRMELDLTVSFMPVTTTDRFDKVANGEVDLLCGAATITLSRREMVDFSIPIYVDGTALMVPNEASGRLEDLAGQKIGVRTGTTTEEAVTNSFAAGNVDVEIVGFDAHPDGFKALDQGEISAYFADQSILLVNYVTGGMTERFKISDEILTIEKHGLAMARGDADFRLLVDAVLSEMYANGSMEDLFASALPGVSPGAAMQAMYLIAPTLP